MDTSRTKAADLQQRILDNLSTAIMLLGEDLRVKCVNPACEILLEVSGRQVVGKHIGELLSAERLGPEVLQGTLSSGHPFTDRELPLSLPNGRQVTVDCSVTPLSGSGQPNELLVELQNVDRHLRISREEALMAQQQATRMLVRGLAHEIKNPLGGLRGAAQLLQRELPEPGLREYTQIIIGEADRLQKLVNRLLGPHALPRKRLVNIHEVLERVRGLALAEASADLQVTRNYDPSIPELYADPDLLIQAVLNIVRNASQALEGQGEINLRTRTVRRFTIGQRCHRLVVRIDITDNGPGIPDDIKESMFYPMVSSRADGTGLGLSIAQNLIHQHGGLVECNTHPGKTTFSLYLPLESNHGA